MIEILNLVKRFGPTITAVDGISFHVGKGEVLGFLGPNGAGKSTTMKMITGFLAPSAGSVRILGCDIRDDPIGTKEKIGYLPEGAPAYPDMTPREFLRFIADIRQIPHARQTELITLAVQRTELAGVMEQPIDTLSKGFKRRVGLAQAILHDPPVLIMDEPTDGLDPNQKHAVRSLIRRMAPEKAIIISTHILEEVDAICDRAIIIDRGKIVADGTPDALMARSHHHNAVQITLDSEIAKSAEEAFLAMPHVAEISRHEVQDKTAALTRFTIYPREGQRLVDEIGAFARARGWSTHELYAEAGRLDEVFRSVTTGDTQ